MYSEYATVLWWPRCGKRRVRVLVGIQGARHWYINTAKYNSLDTSIAVTHIHSPLIPYQNCRQPLSFFQNHKDRSNDSSSTDVQQDEDHNDEHLPPPGAYTVQTTCEYCGASHIRLCSPTCSRPKLFLRKQRPPFCSNAERWDAVTEYEIDLVIPSLAAAAAHDAAAVDDAAVADAIANINTANAIVTVGGNDDEENKEDDSSQPVPATLGIRSDPNGGSFNSITSEMPLTEVIVIGNKDEDDEEEKDHPIPLHQHNPVTRFSSEEMMDEKKDGESVEVLLVSPLESAPDINPASSSDDDHGVWWMTTLCSGPLSSHTTRTSSSSSVPLPVQSAEAAPASEVVSF